MLGLYIHIYQHKVLVVKVAGILKPHPQSASGSVTSTGRVTISGLESPDCTNTESLPLVDTTSTPSLDKYEPDVMAEVTDYDNIPATDEDEAPGNGDAGKERAHVGGTQADMIKMATLMTEPALQRAESMEVLHLTLHQVLFYSLQVLKFTLLKHSHV